jgi:hypothetical protein
MRIRLIFHRIDGRWKNPRSWVLLAVVAAYLGFAFLFVPGDGGVRLAGYRLPPCPLKTLTGIPCPFCGLTTGSAWAVRGAWVKAWDSNILSPVLVSFAIAMAAYTLLIRLAAARDLRMTVSGPKDWQWVLLGTLIAVSWTVNLLRR